MWSANRIRSVLKKYWNRIEPYQDVALFMVCLLAAHFFWKFTINADENGGPVYWFGLNISWPFDALAEHIARTTYRLLRLTVDTVRYVPPYVIRFQNGHGLAIIWGCTGIKQSFIWLVIMAFARGPWKHKAWFIPAGWVCIYLFNMLRVVVIALIMMPRPDLFELMHTYIFKYLFYGMMFLLWVLWVEKFDTQRDERLSA